MVALPSPIPHPLDFCPWDLPGWAYEALEWVVGFDWPEGNEKETWAVADHWYAAAQDLIGPRDDAFEAAGVITEGYGGVGGTAEAFAANWRKVSQGDDAPLVALLNLTNEIGKMVEETGCDIEGAKIEAWIELTLFVIELIALAVTVALTLGAASPAAGGIIAATRIAIQQIFKRLVAQLSKKAIKKSLKEASERAAKQLTSKAGWKKLGKEALDEGWDEAREELAINFGIQAYQTSTGRADGIDGMDLLKSGAVGFAGGAAASGASIGKGGNSGGFDNMFRGAGGEVLGEIGGSVASGQGMPDLESMGKGATSGAAGSLVGSGQQSASNAMNNLAALGGLPAAP
ncbi:MAG TPA: hypothetical protein VES42_05085, partial [Pilimelia sp.]|nr:hypothetical protein [Pilimelia sp.]